MGVGGCDSVHEGERCSSPVTGAEGVQNYGYGRIRFGGF